MTVSDSQFAAFVDRVMNCRDAEDRAKADTKALYAEIAEAGEDKTAIGQLVRELRVSEKDRIKANLRDAAVEDGRARYRRGKASHIRAREDEPEHDAETGEVKESTAARKDVPGSLPVIETHPRKSDQGDGYPHKDGERSPDTEEGSQQSQVAGTPAGTQAPPVDTTLTLGKIEGHSEPEAALLPQTGGVETLVANSEPLVVASTDALSSGSATREDAATAAPNATNITQLHKFNPATHFANSKGLPRLHGCLKPDACGGSHRALCHSCARASQGSAA